MLRPRGGSARRLLAAACALFAAAVLVPGEALAQSVDGDTGTARSQAAILSTGSVAKTADMDFGKIAQSNTPGTVVLTPALSATCAVTGGLIRTGTCRAARFSLYGKKNKNVKIRENNGGQITLNGPAGATMQLTDLQVGVTGMNSKTTSTGWDFGMWKVTANDGVAEFYVGGTLHVGAAQAPGVYNGTLLIEINMN